MNDFFINRRSVRNYSKRDVDDKMLREMLREAAQAPTTGNMQLYSVIVTRSDEGKAALAPAHFGQPAVTGAAVVLTFCADFNRFVKWCEASDAKPGYDNFEMFMCAVLDTAIVAQQFVTIAEMRGLGTCYMGTTTYNAPQIGAALQLPKLVVPVVTVTVGWPEGETEVSGRLPLDSFVFEEKYVERTPGEIRAFFAEKEERDGHFARENGKETLAQVYTDIRYTRADAEHFSRVYRDYIEQQGFRFPDSVPLIQGFCR